MLTLGLVVVWQLLQELTRFFFHANHIAGARGTTFTPRWTLTGLHLPLDELGAPSREALLERRADPTNIELLAGVKDRSLVDEVAKVEYGMARRVLRVQVIVLRYIKALLVVLVTLLALWCPTVLFVASAPVRFGADDQFAVAPAYNSAITAK